MNKNTKVIVSVIAVLTVIGGAFSIKSINKKVETELRYALIDADMVDYIRYKKASFNLINQRIEITDYTFDAGKFLQDRKFSRDDSNLIIGIEKLSFKPPKNESQWTEELDIQFTQLKPIEFNNMPADFHRLIKKMDMKDLSFDGALFMSLVRSDKSSFSLTLKNKSIGDFEIDMASDYVNPLMDMLESAGNKRYNELFEALFMMGDLRVSSFNAQLQNNLAQSTISRYFNLSSFSLPGETMTIDDIANTLSNAFLNDLTDMGLSARKTEEYKGVLMKVITENKPLKVSINPAQSVKWEHLLKLLWQQDVDDTIDELSFKVSH